jgi:hypothetical protein
MPQYHRHPDGLVFVRGTDTTYTDTVEQFTADYGSVPGLPDGMNEQFYEPGIRHFYANGNEALPLPLEWEEGDLIISALPALLDIQARRTMGENPIE